MQYIVRKYSSPRYNYGKVKYWVYTKDEAEEEGIDYKVCKDFDDILVGDKFLTDDGYVIDCIDKFSYLGTVAIVTPTGTLLEGLSNLHAMPKTRKVRDIKGFANLKLGNGDSPLYTKFFKLFMENPERSMYDTMRDAMAEVSNLPKEKVAPFYILTKIQRICNKDFIREIIMKQTAESFKVALERTTTELNQSIIAELELAGITPKTIAKKMGELMESDNPRIALESLKEVNKIMDSYPKKSKTTGNYTAPALHLKPSEAAKIKEIADNAVEVADIEETGVKNE